MLLFFLTLLCSIVIGTGATILRSGLARMPYGSVGVGVTLLAMGIIWGCIMIKCIYLNRSR